MALPESAFRLPKGADHPVLRQAFAYWAGKAPPGRLPGRQHIDPVEMRDFLPHLALFEVDRSGAVPRFFVRVEGSVMVAAFHRDSTGHYLDDLVREGGAAASLARLHNLLETRLPYYTAATLPVPNQEHVEVRRVVLPLAADGETVDRVLACGVIERLSRLDIGP